MAADSVFVTAPPKIVENDSSYSFVSYFSVVFLVFQKRKRPPKPLIECQNWVTMAGGRHNLVPGVHFALLSVAGVVCHIYEV